MHVSGQGHKKFCLADVFRKDRQQDCEVVTKMMKDKKVAAPALGSDRDLAHPQASEHYEVLQSMVAPGACEQLLDAGETLLATLMR